MSLLQDVSALFGEESLSWNEILDVAISASWSDWHNGDRGAREIIKKIEAQADAIIAISQEYNLVIERIAKNAVAFSQKDRLSVARLVIHKLFVDGKLKENEEYWLSTLPKPSSLTAFLFNVVSGEFVPTVAAFAEILSAGLKTDWELNCISNVLRCLSPVPATSSELFYRLKRLPPLTRVAAAKLLDALKTRLEYETLDPDIDLVQLAVLPREWRRAILANIEISKKYLSAATINAIAVSPQPFPDTPEDIRNEELVQTLTVGVKGGVLNGELISEILSRPMLLEKLEKEFDWSVLPSSVHTFTFDENGGQLPRLAEFLDRAETGTFVANLAALAISAMTFGPADGPKTERDTARGLLAKADKVVLKFAVARARGSAQAFLIGYLIRDAGDLSERQLAVDATFSRFDEKVRLDAVILLLPWASPRQKRAFYVFAYASEMVSRDLLIHDEGYRDFVLNNIGRGHVAPLCVSDRLFCVYGKLGSKGAEIVEALIKRRKEIPHKLSARSLLNKVIEKAPTLAGIVFANRGINTDAFTRVILNDDFKKMPHSAQVGIFRLTSRRGKSVLQLNIERGLISRSFIEWIETQDHLRPFVVAHSPNALISYQVRLSELLAASTNRPTKAMSAFSKTKREELLEALPEALRLLEHKPRVAAALELAVRSELAALPFLMRLVQRLAPPFKKSDYGKRFDDLYITYELPKRSGGKRTISAPAVHLKATQRALLTLLYSEGFSDPAMGFVPGRSTKDNAARHIGRKIVVNADIRGFFSSTTYGRVYSLSRRLCNGTLSPLAARLFAEICCHSARLATGAPTSPAVSNLIMRNFDHGLNGIAEKIGVTYTRYADDLTFSGDSAAVWMLKPLAKRLVALEYELDPKKTNIFRRGRRQTVTGVVVNKKVNLARPTRKILRAAVHLRAKGEQPFYQGKPLSDAALRGHLAYLNMICPENAKSLLDKLKGSSEWHN
jgi:retron-type reverse transcriptase